MYSRFRQVTALWLAATLGAAQQVCNNAEALCDKKYNEISYLGAHDSPFVRDSSTAYSLAGDQFYNSTVQLDAGVRMLSAQVHKVHEDSGDQYRLCHTNCGLLDAGLLTDWLAALKTWLDNHPDDVVTILLVNSDNTDAPTLNEQFAAANIVDYAYTPPTTTSPTTDWPTLRDMISQNKRLVVLIASLDPTTNTQATYLLDQYTFTFENSYDNTSPDSYSCNADRPSTDTAGLLSSGHLPLMNHFLYDVPFPGIEISAPEKANDTNAPAGGPAGNVGDAANTCTQAWGRKPAYIFVDFFNAGPAIATVDTLNGVAGQTSGRTGPGTSLEASDEIANAADGMQGDFTAVSSAMQGTTQSVASTTEDVASTMESSLSSIFTRKDGTTANPGSVTSAKDNTVTATSQGVAPGHVRRISKRRVVMPAVAGAIGGALLG